MKAADAAEHRCCADDAGSYIFEPAPLPLVFAVAETVGPMVLEWNWMGEQGDTMEQRERSKYFESPGYGLNGRGE